jgi:hypothetical protein
MHDYEYEYEYEHDLDHTQREFESALQEPTGPGIGALRFH